ncbi:MAG: hypothetical protein SFT92_04305 [Rickettsiales bacterium]|nr:hypothetical protein [Rickettsiales bacterium]
MSNKADIFASIQRDWNQVFSLSGLDPVELSQSCVDVGEDKFFSLSSALYGPQTEDRQLIATATHR